MSNDAPTDDVEMQETASMMGSGKKDSTKDDGEKKPEKRYSSSSLVVAADELKFKTKKEATNIKKKEKEGRISKKEAKQQLKAAYKTLAHTFDKNALEKEYNTSLDNGLNNDSYNKAFEKFGENKLTPPKQTPWYIRLLLSIFGGFFNVLLWFGSVLCFIAFGADPNEIKDQTNLYLGIVLAVVVTLTGIFSYFQESKSADLMASLQAMNTIKDVEVIRNGKPQLVDPVKLVPGDVVNVGSGQAVPADIRIFACSPDMEVNNASLTGESEPCKRDWRKEEDDVQPGDSNNLMFFGTNIVNGKGSGVVFATGDDTFMGRTAALATSTDNESTPIAKEIKDFVLKVSGIAFVLGISFFIIGMLDNKDLVRNVIFLIGIIVANVPEGLLATVTVSLTLTAGKMYQKNVRVKNLESVETLGSTSVICSDKTGTLTTSIMTAQHIYFDLEEKLCDTDQPMSALKGDFYEKDSNKRLTDFLKLTRCGALCNNAEFVNEPSNPAVHGTVATNANPTEAAMVKFSAGHVSAEYRVNVPQYRQDHAKLHEIPFNSKNKWQVSVHALKNEFLIGEESKLADADDEKELDKRALVQMKGAPERILALCDRHVFEGEIQELDDQTRDKIMEGVLSLGSRGERVLALAESILDAKKYNISISEPKCPHKNLSEVDQEYADQDSVVVQFFEHAEDHEGTKFIIPVSGKDEDGNVLEFGNCFIWSIKYKVAKKAGIEYDSTRLYYGNTDEYLAGDETLKAAGIKKGSVIYAYKGPYKFKGTGSDTVNWPFRRKLKDIPYTDPDEEVKDDDKFEEGLVFVGLYAMIDPPRPGVPEAVASCQSAGIKVIMVTGDHPVTAKAIAQQVGIIGLKDDGTPAVTLEDAAKSDKYGGNTSMVNEADYQARVVPGWELAKVLEVEEEDRQQVENFWNTTLATKYVVFARTSPQQKLLIVSAVQDRGGIVAVTGDGVNDSPALKKADIGCAMGITGTDVAKEAADMILLDDNFASIVNGVEEGRIIFDNLKKSIAYTLSSNIPEIAPFLIYQTVGIPLPLTTVMILLVDLGTDLAPAISMAYEGREANIMKKPPRNPEKDKLVTWRLVSFAYLQIGMLQALAGFYAYFVVLEGYGLQYPYLPRLDKKRAFVTTTNLNLRRDAYWLWCFTPDSSNTALWAYDKCIYTPEFAFSFQEIDYYNNKMFYGWLNNNDATDHGYIPLAKDHIYTTCKKVSQSCLLVENILYGGKVGNTVIVWNTDNWGNTDEVNAFNKQYPDCSMSVGGTTSCNIISFKTSWTIEIEPIYRAHTVHYKNRPNRRCELKDLQSTYNEDHTKSFDKTPTTCNAYQHQIKPRTYAIFPESNIDSAFEFANIKGATVNPPEAYSIFPMQMQTRTEALARANSAYFLSIIIVQWADLMICKTREISLFQQGMTNTFMNYALIFETILGAFLVYVPVSNRVTGTRPVRFVWWTAGIPFSLMIYVYDEMRKGIIRKNPGGWIHRNTYW